jgi:septation ring formation regulator EzrA
MSIIETAEVLAPPLKAFKKQSQERLAQLAKQIAAGEQVTPSQIRECLGETGATTTELQSLVRSHEMLHELETAKAEQQDAQATAARWSAARKSAESRRNLLAQTCEAEMARANNAVQQMQAGEQGAIETMNSTVQRISVLTRELKNRGILPTRDPRLDGSFRSIPNGFGGPVGFE